MSRRSPPDLDPARLYACLGCTPHATIDGIKSAYRRLAKTLHPDAGGNAESFDRISRAHAVLSDPEKKARYDATGEVDDAATNDPLLGLVTKKLHATLEMIIATIVLKEKQDPRRIDLLAILRDVLKDDLERMRHTAEVVERAREDFPDVADRFFVRDDGENRLRSAVMAQVLVLDKGLEDLRREIEVVERLLADFDRHGYRFDQLVDSPGQRRAVANMEEILRQYGIGAS